MAQKLAEKNEQIAKLERRTEHTQMEGTQGLLVNAAELEEELESRTQVIIADAEAVLEALVWFTSSALFCHALCFVRRNGKMSRFLMTSLPGKKKPRCLQMKSQSGNRKRNCFQMNSLLGSCLSVNST